MKLARRNLLSCEARLLKQSGVNRLKVEHHRTLTISRAFYDLLLKLDRRRLLIHAARLLKQSREIRETTSIIGLGTYSAFCAL